MTPDLPTQPGVWERAEGWWIVIVRRKEGAGKIKPWLQYSGFGDGCIVSGRIHESNTPIGGWSQLTPAGQSVEQLANILPASFYADRPLAIRLEFLVRGWQTAVQACNELERKRDELIADSRKLAAVRERLAKAAFWYLPQRFVAECLKLIDQP